MTSIDSAFVLLALVALPVFVAAAWTWWQGVLADRSLQALEGCAGMSVET